MMSTLVRVGYAYIYNFVFRVCHVSNVVVDVVLVVSQLLSLVTDGKSKCTCTLLIDQRILIKRTSKNRHTLNARDLHKVSDTWIHVDLYCSHADRTLNAWN